MTYLSRLEGKGGIAPTNTKPDARRWVVSTTIRPLYPGKTPVPIVQEAEWASGPVWTARKTSTPPGFDIRTVQRVASRCYGSAILAACGKTYAINAKQICESPANCDPLIRNNA